MSQTQSSPSASGASLPAVRHDSPLLSANGTTTIADSVVSKIAGIAAADVSGVHALGGGAARAVSSLRERIPGQKASVSQGVSVQVTEQTAIVEISAVVDYGVAIADVAAGIRANVIRSVEQMTGMTVSSVDVSVLDIYLPGDESDSDDQ